MLIDTYERTLERAHVQVSHNACWIALCIHVLHESSLPRMLIGPEGLSVLSRLKTFDMATGAQVANVLP